MKVLDTFFSFKAINFSKLILISVFNFFIKCEASHHSDLHYNDHPILYRAMPYHPMPYGTMLHHAPFFAAGYEVSSTRAPQQHPSNHDLHQNGRSNNNRRAETQQTFIHRSNKTPQTQAKSNLKVHDAEAKRNSNGWGLLDKRKESGFRDAGSKPYKQQLITPELAIKNKNDVITFKSKKNKPKSKIDKVILPGLEKDLSSRSLDPQIYKSQLSRQPELEQKTIRISLKELRVYMVSKIDPKYLSNTSSINMEIEGIDGKGFSLHNMNELKGNPKINLQYRRGSGSMEYGALLNKLGTLSYDEGQKFISYIKTLLRGNIPEGFSNYSAISKERSMKDVAYDLAMICLTSENKRSPYAPALLYHALKTAEKYLKKNKYIDVKDLLKNMYGTAEPENSIRQNERDSPFYIGGPKKAAEKLRTYEDSLRGAKLLSSSDFENYYDKVNEFGKEYNLTPVNKNSEANRTGTSDELSGNL